MNAGASSIASGIRRWARGLLMVLLLVVLAGSLGLAWLLASDAGTRFIADHVGEWVPGISLQYQTLEGRLTGALHVGGLRLRLADVDVDAASLDLDWSPMALLLAHRVEVQALTASALRVRLHPQPSTPQPATPPNVGALPVDIVIERLQVDRVDLTGAGHPRRFSDVRLRGQWLGALVNIDELAVATAPTGALRLNGSAWLAGDRIDLRQLTLRGPGRVDAQGVVGLGDVPSDLSLRLTDLRWPIDDSAAQVGHVDGRLHLAGSLQHYQLGLNLAATAQGIPLRLEGEGSGNLQNARIARLHLATDRGAADLSGQVAWQPKLRADLQAKLRDIDPSLFAPAWKGSLNGTVTAKTLSDTDIAFSASLDRSQLRGKLLTLDARGDLLNREAVVLGPSTLSFGRSRLQVQGRVSAPYDVTARLVSPDLAAIDPIISGHVDMTAHFSGTLDDPHLVTRGNAGGLKQGSRSIDALDWDADLAAKLPSRLALHATGVAVGAVIDRVSLTGDGTEIFHHLQLKAETPQGKLELAVQGGFDRKRQEWGGEVMSLQLAPKQLAPWALEKPTGLLVGRQRFSIESLCLAMQATVDSDRGEACVNLLRGVRDPGFAVQWRLKAFQLAALQPVIGKVPQVSGLLVGDGQLKVIDGDVSALHASLSLSEVRIAVPKAPVIELLPSHLEVGEDGQRLHAAFDVQLPQGHLNGDLTAEAASRFDQRPLSGSVKLQVPDLSFIGNLVPELRDVGGTIDGQLKVAGTLGQPKIGGDLRLAAGHARLLTPGITLENVGLHISGDGDGPLAISGVAQAGGGSLLLSGSVDPAATPLAAAIDISGSNFLAAAIPDARVWISPQLHLVLDAAGATVTGTLNVPHADITPQGFGDGGVSVSRDQVLVGAKPEEKSAGMPIHSDVKVVLGDKVQFTGFGLKTRLTGAVSVIETPNQDTRGLGEIQLIDGVYKAYGQDLTIDTGRLIFGGGDITEPAVDLYAVRRPTSDITVGVRVRGTLDQPELSLQSTPAMSREQQISWLVLGRGLDSTSSDDRSLISSAALSLGLGGGGLLGSWLGKKVGLDEVSVGAAPVVGSDVAPNANTITGSEAARNAGSSATGTSAASVTLGKYLTPKLFISYGLGLFDNSNTLRLLYTLKYGFKLQTESGTVSGGDLIWSKAFGKVSPPPAATSDTTPHAGP